MSSRSPLLAPDQAPHRLPQGQGIRRAPDSSPDPQQAPAAVHEVRAGSLPSRSPHPRTAPISSVLCTQPAGQFLSSVLVLISGRDVSTAPSTRGPRSPSAFVFRHRRHFVFFSAPHKKFIFSARLVSLTAAVTAASSTMVTAPESCLGDRSEDVV